MAHQHGMAGGARRPDRGAVERRSTATDVSASADRRRRRARAAAGAPLRQRRRRRADELRARVRLRPYRRRVGVHELGVRRSGRTRTRGGPRAPVDDQHAPGVGGTVGGRDPSDGGGRPGLRRAVVVGRRSAADVRGRGRVHAPDRGLLAWVAEPRSVPRPSVARDPAAQRPHAEGPDVRAHRCAAGRGHDLPPRDPRRGTELGLPIQLGARRSVRAVGPVHARLRLRSEQLLLLHRRPDRRRLAAQGVVRGRRRGRPRANPRSTISRDTRTLVPSAPATTPTTRSSTTSGGRCCMRCTSTRAPASSSPA